MKLSPAELLEARAFAEGRHQPEEWDAFFDYYSRPRWQRRLLSVLGVLMVAFGYVR
jgi:hypothetical protein